MWQNAKAGLFNTGVRVYESFGYSSSLIGGVNLRMRVNYDEYGGIPYGDPVKFVLETEKSGLAEAGDATLDLLSITPLGVLVKELLY